MLSRDVILVAEFRQPGELRGSGLLRYDISTGRYPPCEIAFHVRSDPLVETIVDDARVAGGIAADGMNINARPRRRVAGKTPMITPTTIRHPMLSSYDTGESCS